MSTSQSSPSRARSRRLSGSQIWLALVSALVLGALVLIVVRTMGRVQGEEFSPTHFRARTFSFYEIPLIHWQITPIHRSVSTPRTATFLTQKSWIAPPPGEPTVWHLVSLRRGIEEAQDADAALLVDHLRLRGAGGSFWRKWSQDNPQRAGVLWPAIGKLAQRELYILMPRLLEMASEIDAAEPLRDAIASYLRQEYATLVRDMRAAGRDELADALVAEAAHDEHLAELHGEKLTEHPAD